MAVTIKMLRRVTAGFLATLIGGCGLADYEAEMRTAQDRVERFTEESDLLGDAITIPTMKEPPQKDTIIAAQPPKAKEAPKPPKAGAKDTPKESGKDAAKEKRVPAIRYSLFLRLPRGIRTTAEPDPQFDLVFHLPRGASPSAKPGPFSMEKAPPALGGFLEVYLAFGTEASTTFVDRVANVFPHGSEPVMASKPDVVVPERREPLSFDLREFTDARSTWSVYAHTEGNSTVAIVYRVDKEQKKNAARAIQLSLSTLAIGPEADAVTASYARRPK
jgi:hypothetical protein